MSNQSLAPRGSAAEIPLMMMVQNFHLGGTEGQAVELLRKLPPTWRTRVACVARQGPHLASLAELGLEPLELSLQGSLAQVNTGRQIWRLAGALRQGGIRLVHAHDFYTTLLAVPAARLAGCKVVVGRLDLGHWPTGLSKRLLQRATAAADGVIANAHAIRDQLVSEEGLAPSKVCVIPNGIDLGRFDAAAARGLTEPLPELAGKRVFVHLANMTHPVKAQEDLFAAVKTLQPDHPELAVLLVGTGARRDALKRLAAQLGIAERVHFLGHRLDVAAVLKHAFAGVLCSHAEGMSNALIEYLAAGLPAVATRVGGSGEVVAHGERGLLVPSRSPFALAAAMERLLRNPALAAKMGAQGRAYVERELTTDRLAERHDRFYREVLG